MEVDQQAATYSNQAQLESNPANKEASTPAVNNDSQAQLVPIPQSQ